MLVSLQNAFFITFEKKAMGVKRFFNRLTVGQGLWIIMAAGLLARVLFLLVGAPLYFPRENFMLDGDSLSWMKSIENLIHNGGYTIDPDSTYGYFSRMPGYPFFIGFFYIVSGFNWAIALHLVVWAQIVLDVMAIWLVCKMLVNINERNSVAGIIGAVLYAFYPFVIVWNPVIYTESFSVFVLLAGMYFVLKPAGKIQNYFIGGWLLGLAVLCRPQLGLILVAVGVYALFSIKPLSALMRHALVLGLGVLLSYGVWPLRNILIHKEFVVLEDLRAYHDFDIDVVSFRAYVYSIKSEWEPQFSQIVENKEVDWPPISFISSEDSLLLAELTFKAKECSEGFSHWKGYWKERVTDNGCKNEVAAGFDLLRKNQIKANPFNYYGRVPLNNLKKAVFKAQLSQQKAGWMNAVVVLLFSWRSLLLLSGLFAGMYLLLKKKQKWVLIPLVYGIGLYLILCFGPSTHFRNIEMRYFLHADVLFLLPLASFAGWFFKKE